MRIPILIEKVPGNGFRARGGEPLAIVAEGPTRAEALSELKRLIEDRLAVGAELVGLDVATKEHPFPPIPDWTEQDSLLDEWQDAMDAYRRQVEADPGR